jgi:hypothetical protein
MISIGWPTGCLLCDARVAQNRPSTDSGSPETQGLSVRVTAPAHEISFDHHPDVYGGSRLRPLPVQPLDAVFLVSRDVACLRGTGVVARMGDRHEGGVFGFLTKTQATYDAAFIAGSCLGWLVMTPPSLCVWASLPSPGMPDILRAAPDDARSYPEDAVRRADHTASPRLHLAEGRLRLDRLSRNGGGSTFFPWAEAHSSRGKKLPPPPSSAALRPTKVASSSAPGLPIAIEAAMVAGSKQTRRSDVANIGSFKKVGAARSRARSSP